MSNTKKEIIQDIKFEINDINFNVRSSCIIKDKLHKRVLLTNMREIITHEAFLLPGGRLNLLENSKETITREIKEELNLNLDYKLISIEENIAKEKQFHMIEFVYYTEIDNFDLFNNLDNGWDKFKIFDINDIDSLDIRPKTIKDLIKQKEYESISHNINYDWLKN